MHTMCTMLLSPCHSAHLEESPRLLLQKGTFIIHPPPVSFSSVKKNAFCYSENAAFSHAVDQVKYPRSKQLHPCLCRSCQRGSPPPFLHAHGYSRPRSLFRLNQNRACGNLVLTGSSREDRGGREGAGHRQERERDQSSKHCLLQVWSDGRGVYYQATQSETSVILSQRGRRTKLLQPPN
jgi:hypothetical protein